MPLLLTLLACHLFSSGEPSTGWEAFAQLGEAKVTDSKSLHLNPDEVLLAQPHWQSMGIDPDTLTEWTLSATPHNRDAGAEHAFSNYKVDFPISLTPQEKKFKPLGMTVRVGDEVLPYSRSGGAAKQAGWGIQGGRLVVTHPHHVDVLDITVNYPAVASRLRELVPPSQPEEHARHARRTLTLGGRTRDGLMLPCGSSASWTLEVPPDQPRWVSRVALEPSRLPGRQSDGASLVLTAHVEGHEPVELAHRELTLKALSFEPWEVDLSRFAGQTVRLVVETGPGPAGDPLFDWVFLGSPSIQAHTDGVPRRVVVIGVDTLRRDKITGPTRVSPLPGFDTLGGGSVQFVRTWTPAPRTRPSFRAATTGRLPLEAVGAENIGSVFQRNGWATAGLVANIHLQPRFGFHKGYDYWHFAGDRDAELQVDEALAWLTEQAQRDAFLFLHFMDPHLPYHAPQPFLDKHTTDSDPDLPDRFSRGMVLDWQRKGRLSDTRKAHIEARHDGEVAYLDSQIARLVDAIDRLPGESLVVLHNDHGEEFWDHKGFEHNHTLHEELVNAVLWFRPTGGLQAPIPLQTPATLADIGPTLYTLAGLSDPPPTDGLDLSPWIREPMMDGGWTRPLPLGYLQYGHDRWSVLWKDHKYILHTGTGREELYDLKSDPKEATDLSSTTDTSVFVDQLRIAHQLPEQAVGPGLRVRIQANDPNWRLHVALPEECLQAGVLDPEVVLERRSNLEWGESPKRRVEDVANVTLDATGTQITVEPGSQPHGVLWVRCEKMPDVDKVALSLGEDELVSQPGRKRNRVWSAEGRTFTVTPGWVLIPPPSEHARMAASSGEDTPNQSELDLLKSLGYIGHTEEAH